MKITIEIPDATFREVKSLAVRKQVGLNDFILRAIRVEIGRARRVGWERFSVQLPLILSKKPGASKSLTNSEIEDLLD